MHADPKHALSDRHRRAVPTTLLTGVSAARERMRAEVQRVIALIEKYWFVLGEDRRKIPAFGALFVLQALFELLMTALVAAILVVVVSPASLGTLWAKLPFGAPVLDPAVALPYLAGAAAVAVMVRMAATVLMSRATTRFGLEHKQKLQMRLLRAYQSAPYEFHLERSSAHVVTTILGSARGASDGVITQFLRLFSEATIGLLTVMLLLRINPIVLALICLLLIVFSTVYVLFTRRQVRSSGQEIIAGNRRMAAALQESILGMKEIVVFGKEVYFAGRFEREARDLNRLQLVENQRKLVPKVILEGSIYLLALVGISAAALLSSYVTISPASAAFFAVAGLRLSRTASNIINIVTTMLHGMGALDAVHADLKRLERRASQSDEKLAAGLTAQKLRFESLELRDVAFRYHEGKQDVLSRVSFRLRHGEAVGIVGPSGSGKSTLIDLILGLLEPTAGEILVDGRPVREVLRRWQAVIAYIPQQIFVVDDTIRRNVALGVLDQDIDEGLLGEALRKARLGEFVAGLPLGLETRLGDRGVRLSGGQRQRIALARAIYHEREILILDEATSALDNELEAEIVEEVAGLKGQKTMIVIAHRLTTLRHCDRVIEVKGGSISIVNQATPGPTTRGFQ